MIINFGTRRLQKGSTSFVLPIPPQWINSVGASKGATFKIETTDENSLKISPNSESLSGSN